LSSVAAGTLSMSGNYRILADSGRTMYSRKEFEEPSSLLHNTTKTKFFFLTTWWLLQETIAILYTMWRIY